MNNERPTMSDEQPARNTDRELWREVNRDYYSPSIHVTQDGGIGINVGGTVRVRTLRDWHGSEARNAELTAELTDLRTQLDAAKKNIDELQAACRAALALPRLTDEIAAYVRGGCDGELHSACDRRKAIVSTLTAAIAATDGGTA